MAFEHYITAGGKKLRCGYTTGTAAALAAAGATRLLLSGQVPPVVRLVTPKGFAVEVQPRHCEMDSTWAQCAVQKDAGDDIDATAGALIFARVTKIEAPSIVLDGGEGVGRVTRRGLD
ncbi:MAG: cobalt-precorrin-5B (C(1))-methyltransferase, partial [Pygmaiobacter sp.]